MAEVEKCERCGEPIVDERSDVERERRPGPPKLHIHRRAAREVLYDGRTPGSIDGFRQGQLW